jgi:hypothetical protein
MEGGVVFTVEEPAVRVGYTVTGLVLTPRTRDGLPAFPSIFLENAAEAFFEERYDIALAPHLLYRS